MKKLKFTSMVLCFALALPLTEASAHHNQWSYSHYTKGMEYITKADYTNAIKELEVAVKQEPGASYYRKLAEAYKANGQFQKAAEIHYKEAGMYKEMGDMNTYYAVIRIADALNSEVKLYMTSETNEHKYPLQKYEPSNGIYIGAFLENENKVNYASRFAEFNEKTEKKHAVYFTYHRYGWSFPHAWVEKVKKEGGSIHLALQPDEGLKLIEDGEYLRQFAKDAYASGVPIFLRYASEMNGSWVKWHGDPKLYIEKFRLIAEVMKEEAPNVAMVWSPAANPKEEMNKYYPGDDYVDWVGVNHYSNNFRNGDINTPNDNTNPIEEIRYVYDTYSDQKPIMVSEYGASNMSAADMKDASEFAIAKMHMMYEGIKLNYPRVKAINWFSMNTMTHASRDERKITNYSLMENEKVFNSYKDMIRDEYYLSSVVNGEYAQQETVAPAFIKPFKRQSIMKPVTLMSWVTTYTPYVGKVTYELNNKEKGTALQYPFALTVNPEDLTKGRNDVKITVYTKDNQIAYRTTERLFKPLHEREHAKVFIGNKEVFTKDNMKELLFAPYVTKGRTMVPVRMISEQLGINVTWNQKEKTVTLEDAGKTLVLTVNNENVLMSKKNVKIDVAPQVKYGTTFVPVRFASENLGLGVTYHHGEKSVLVERKE